MVNKLSSMGRNRKVVQGNKRSGSACPIALHHPQQAVGALTSYMGVRNRHIEEWDKHKKACHIDIAGSPAVDFDKEHCKDRI